MSPLFVGIQTTKNEKIIVNITKILFLVKNEKKNTFTVFLDSGDYFDIDEENKNRLKFFISDNAVIHSEK